MPAQNPYIGTDPGHSQWGASGPDPIIDVIETGLPSAITTTVFTTPTNNSGVNAAGTSENVALHVAVLIALALVGVFVFRQAGVKFAVAAGVGGR